MRILPAGAVLLALLSATVPVAVQAQTATKPFSVRANVTAICVITTNDLDFGDYQFTAEATASTPLQLQCTPGAGATVSFSPGMSGDAGDRHMVGPASAELTYALYRDSGHSDIIDGTPPAFELVGAENDGTVETWTIYGRVPAGQSAPEGAYVDTITVTVDY